MTVHELSVAGKVYATAELYPEVVRKGREGMSLVAYTSMAIEAADAPLYLGFPRAPKVWARLPIMTSVTGNYLSSSRPMPREVNIDSDARWLPESALYVGGYWYPIQGSRRLSAPALASPALQELDYLSGKELISRSAMRISNGAHFFTEQGDSYLTMTISMVVMLNPSTDDYPILDQLVDPGADRLALWSTDKIDYYWAGTGGSVDPIVAMAKCRPLVITLVVNPPSVSCYASYSPRHHFASTKTAPNPITGRPLNYAIGASYAGIGSDFWLLEVNRWNRPLDADEVATLHNTYFSVYGVHSDWA